MSAGKYRLQTVMDVRERARQEAGKIVASRRAEHADAEAELRRRTAEVESCREQQRAARDTMMQTLAGGTEIRTINAHNTHLADLRARETELLAAVEQQRSVVRRAEEAVDQALARLTEAAKELQVLEKHRDGWRHERRRTEERREQKMSDEIGAILHRRRTHDAT